MRIEEYGSAWRIVRGVERRKTHPRLPILPRPRDCGVDPARSNSRQNCEVPPVLRAAAET